MLIKGLVETKKSVISFCKTTIQTRVDRGLANVECDLAPLRSRATSLPASLQPFDENMATSVQVASHSRYVDWFKKTFRGVKHSNGECSGATTDGSKKLRQV